LGSNALVLPGCPADPGELVGKGDTGFVVADAGLELDDPALYSVELLAGPMQLSRSGEDGACAVNEQHAQIGVTAFGDFAKMPPGAA
jgi:hypothetical protein